MDRLMIKSISATTEALIHNYDIHAVELSAPQRNPTQPGVISLRTSHLIACPQRRMLLSSSGASCRYFLCPGHIIGLCTHHSTIAVNIQLHGHSWAMVCKPA